MGYLTVSYVLRSAATGAIQPGKVVKVFPADIPLLAQQDDNTWSPHNSHPELFPSDALTAVVSFKIPWAATSRPTTARFVIAHPDGTSYVGVVPSLATADLEILVDNWGWTPVAGPGFVQIVTYQGKPGLVNRGVYSNTTQYSPGDWVTYNGGTWAALLPTIGVTPVAGAIWQLQAAGGAVTSSTNANLIYAGPTSGGAATPAMRGMVDADLPATISAARIGTGLVAAQIAANAGIAGSQLSNPLTHPGNVNGKFFDNGGAVVNVMHPAYGVTGDGVTFDGAGLLAAITAAGVNGTVLFPPNKTFVVDRELVPMQGQTWLGNGATLKRCNAVSSATTGSVTITTGQAVPALTLTSAAGFQVGQTVSLWTDSTHFDTIVHTILTINGNVVTLSGNANATWTGVVTLFTVGGLIRVSSTDVTLFGLKIDDNRSNNTVFQHWELHQAIHLSAADRAVVENCYIHDCVSEGMEVIGADITVAHNTVINCQGNGIHLSNTNPGYFRILGNHVENCNLSGTATGHADGCIIASNPVYDTLIEGNVCINGIAGIGSWDSDDNTGLICVGNLIKNCTSYALDMVSPNTSPGKVIFSKNIIYNSGILSLNLTSGAAPVGPFRVNIEGNYLEDTTVSLIGAEHTQFVNNTVYNSAWTSLLCTVSNSPYLTIANNRFINGLGGIIIQSAATRDVLVNGNAFIDNSVYAVRMESTTGGPNLRIASNLCKATAGVVATSHGALIINAPYAVVDGNVIDNQASSGQGITLGGGTAGGAGNVCRGNVIRMASNTTRVAITIASAANNSLIVDNTYYGTVSDLGTGTVFGLNYKSDPTAALDTSLATGLVYTSTANTIAPASGVPLTLTPTVGVVGQAIKAPASGSADLQQWQNNGGTALSGITNLGNLYAPAATLTGKAQAASFTSLFTQVGTPYNTAVLADTPSMYWRLDDAAGPVADFSGNGKTGTVAGTVTLGVAGLTQDQDAAASFPGQTSPASIITGPATGIAAHATFSVECIVNLVDYTYDSTGSGGGKNAQYIWLSSNGASERTALKWIAPSTGSGQSNKFGIYTSGADTNTLYSVNTYPAGSIYHVLYVWDATGTTEYLYVNGVLDTSRATPPVTPDLEFPVVLGARTNGFSALFPDPAKGTIDEVAVYTTALSQARATAHAAAVSTFIPKALFYGLGTSYTGDLINVAAGANAVRFDNSGVMQAGSVGAARITSVNPSTLTGTGTVPSAGLPIASAGALGAVRVGSGLAIDGSGILSSTASGGTVTSVGLTAPTEIAVANSPVTTAGTLALTWASAAQNGVFAGPSGSAGTPAFRALVAGDFPAAVALLSRNTQTWTGLPNIFNATTGATANTGTVSIGDAPWDGSTAGKFVGSASGTLLGLNAVSTFAGDLFNAQVAGVSRIKASNLGDLTQTAWAIAGVPTLALAVAGAGVDLGAHGYNVTFTGPNGRETAPGTIASITVTTGNQQVNGSAVPIGPSGTTGRNIWRTVAGGSVYYLAQTIGDNSSTTFTDTMTDATLLTQTPQVSTAAFRGLLSVGQTTVSNVGANTALALNNDAGQMLSLVQTGNLKAAAAGSLISVTRAFGTANGFAASTTSLLVNDNQAAPSGTLVPYSTGDLFRFQVGGTNRLQLSNVGNLTLGAWAVPGAPTLALAGAGAGSVTNGTHVVCITFVNANGETTAGTSSASVNVVDNTVDGRIAVSSAPLGPNGTTSRNVYMSKAGTASPLFLVSGLLPNNTATTCTINIADGSLPATQPPVYNGAIGKITLGAHTISVGQSTNDVLNIGGGALWVTGGAIWGSSGGIMSGSTGAAVAGVATGDIATIRSTTSGRILFGSTTPGALDYGLTTAGMYTAPTGPFVASGGITTKVKAGTPVDGDFAVTPSDGTIAVDSTAGLVWARISGVWKAPVAIHAKTTHGVGQTDTLYIHGGQDYAPSGSYAVENMPRINGSTSITLTSATCNFFYFTPQQDMTVTKLQVAVPGGGSYATGAVTTWQLALYTTTTAGVLSTLLANGSNDTAGGSAAGLYTATIGSTALTAGTRYAIGFLFVANTNNVTPKLVGLSISSIMTNLTPLMSSSVAATNNNLPGVSTGAALPVTPTGNGIVLWGAAAP